MVSRGVSQIEDVRNDIGRLGELHPRIGTALRRSIPAMVRLLSVKPARTSVLEGVRGVSDSDCRTGSVKSVQTLFPISYYSAPRMCCPLASAADTVHRGVRGLEAK